jgi:hypothetical protein
MRDIGASTENPLRRQLFGGAIKCFLDASKWTDASTLRPVPDNQEVFAHALQQASITIELLSISDTHSTRPARYLFDDLAECTGAQVENVEFDGDLSWTSMPGMVPSGAIASAVIGYHRQQNTNSTVRLYMVNLRLEAVTTDLLITLAVHNAEPLPPSMTAGWASASCFGAGGRSVVPEEVVADLQSLLHTIEIVDFGLFS